MLLNLPRDMPLSPVSRFIPGAADSKVQALLDVADLTVEVVPVRKTRHGDYRQLPNGSHVITINQSQNAYRFLLTLIHEIAHFQAFENYGRSIKPHGLEWKRTFKGLMLPFLNPEIFPESILRPLAAYLKRPKASSDADLPLTLALKSFDPPNQKKYIFELPEGSKFKTEQGRLFVRGEKKTKRYMCTEIDGGRVYLFQPHVSVNPLNDQ